MERTSSELISDEYDDNLVQAGAIVVVRFGSIGNVVVVVVVGTTGGSPSASISFPYTHTGVFLGNNPDAQIMSIA